MSRAPECEGAEPTPATWWQRAADRLARYAWLVLLVALALALVGSGVYAATWQPRPNTAQAAVDECENPPCFDIGGMPAIRDLPIIVPTLGYLLAIVLGLPSLLAAAWDLLHGRWATGSRRLLTFVGPVLVFVGTEIVPHLLSPCPVWPGVCEALPEGLDIKDRWHALDHTIVGALPMGALYWLALRRWRPAILWFR